MKILIDADACPGVVKEMLYKISTRLNMKLVFVANQYMQFPSTSLISSVIVKAGPDEADNHIVEIMEAGDLVITEDIPLADRVVKKEGVVLTPRGKLLDGNNIGQKLAVRNLMTDLRNEGIMTGGPKAFGNKEKQLFANAVDKLLTKALRKIEREKNKKASSKEKS